ncbi:hypothetical protein Dcar01_03558 [Deinococcus carri]|uniref:Uncharacterized protein n=1 Tax=Deinococcus carri TaxID=1211323 RepID=A0ABP9WBU7_9DEIO
MNGQPDLSLRTFLRVVLFFLAFFAVLAVGEWIGAVL